MKNMMSPRLKSDNLARSLNSATAACSPWGTFSVEAREVGMSKELFLATS